MRFGKKLRTLRESHQTLMQELARAAGLSIATLSQIEAGRLVPTDETAEKFLAALGLDEESRQQFHSTLKKDRAEWEKQPKERLLFGGELRALLKRINVSGSELARRIKYPTSTVGALVAGSLLPGDALLMDSLIPELQRLGATDAELRALKVAHLQDILSRSLSLKYLSDDVQKKTISLALKEAKKGL